MTDRIFHLTREDVLAIYRAGISRGSEEEASYQCGTRCTGLQNDNLVDTVLDIVSESTSVVVTWSEVEDWFKDK